jgi:hypothetical protein
MKTQEPSNPEQDKSYCNSQSPNESQEASRSCESESLVRKEDASFDSRLMRKDSQGFEENDLHSTVKGSESSYEEGMSCF